MKNKALLFAVDAWDERTKESMMKLFRMYKWDEKMTFREWNAFFRDGTVLDSEFARTTLVPLIEKAEKAYE